MDDARLTGGLPVPLPASRSRGGGGTLVLRNIAGKTAITGIRAEAPLKLLTPRSHSPAAWIVASTYGGGLLAGDEVSVTIAAAADTTALFGTQASTKIFRSPDGIAARQNLSATVGRGALLAVLPDPVTCFADAVYEQRQRFDLDADGSLLLLDWMTSGRAARGERWAFRRVMLSTDVSIDGKPILADRTRLDTDDGPVGGVYRVGGYDCLATVILLGPRLRDPAAKLAEWVHARPIGRPGDLVFSASPLVGGLILRAAGRGSEEVGRLLHDRLGFVPGLLGIDPWLRKY